MSMFLEEKKKIIDAGIKLDRYGLISLAGGNVSMRMPTGEILVTPSGMIYEDMEPDDVLVMDIDGNIIEGTNKPSSDTPQPYATAISLIQKEFRADLTTVGNACGGNVAVTEYSSPGSVEMGMDVVKYLGDSLAVILAHHGVMTVGKNLKQALTAAVYLEETAKGYLAARACGEIEHLSDEQIKQTVEIYKYVGQGTADMPEGLTDRIK